MESVLALECSRGNHKEALKYCQVSASTVSPGASGGHALLLIQQMVGRGRRTRRAWALPKLGAVSATVGEWG